MKTSCWRLFALAIAILSTLGAQSYATLVAPMTMQSVADHSAQVIDAQIMSVRSYWADNPTRIESELTLKPIEFLKGAPSTEPTTFTLIVPGGRVGTKQLRIAGAPELKVGQRWILFLLPTYKTHPVVGITRGAFRVEMDQEHVLRVADVSGNQVTGIDAKGFVQVVAHPDLTTTTATAVATASPTQGLSRDEFAALIRPILDASKTYELNEPAGRREIVQYTPVPFRNDFGATAGVTPLRGARPPIRDLSAQRGVRSEPKSTRTGEPR